MTTMQLRADVFENLNEWLDDEDALLEINAFLLNLKKRMKQVCGCANEDVVPYTKTELNSRIDEAEAEIGGKDSEELFSELEKKHTWLCK